MLVVAALLAVLLAAAAAGAQDPPPPCSGAPHRWYGTPHQSQRTGPEVGSDVSKPLTVDEGSSFTIELCAHVQRYIRLGVHDHGAGVTFTSTADIRWGSYLVSARPGDTVTYTVPSGTAGSIANLTFESWGRKMGRTIVPVAITETQAPPDTRLLAWLDGGTLDTTEGGLISVAIRSEDPAMFPWPRVRHRVSGAGARHPGEYGPDGFTSQKRAVLSDGAWHPDREIVVTLLETDEYRVDPARARIVGVVRDTSPRFLAPSPAALTLDRGGWAEFTIELNGSPGHVAQAEVSVPTRVFGSCLAGRYTPTAANCSSLGSLRTSGGAWGNHLRQRFPIGGQHGATQVVKLRRSPDDHRTADKVITVTTPGGNVAVTLTADPPQPPVVLSPPPTPTPTPTPTPEPEPTTISELLASSEYRGHLVAVRSLAGQTRHGRVHTDRWNSLLAAYGQPPVGAYTGGAITADQACQNTRRYSSSAWRDACAVLKTGLPPS
ncbi:MAG: hypothetical protein OXT07_09165 [bacterium]|nr:hypothetical protein [bacterium]